MTMNSLRLPAACLLILGVAAVRLAAIRVPLLGVEGGANFAPLGALALVSGLMFRHRLLAIGVPLAAALTSDVALAVQNQNDFATYVFNPVMLFVYAAWIAYALCGRGLRLAFSPRTETPRTARWLTKAVALPLGALAGSVCFFLLTNFGVWCCSTTYARSLQGLIDCYVAAVPFFRATIQGDVLYSALFATAAGTVHAVVSRRVPDSPASDLQPE